jgi:hypothetical protein
MRFHEIALLTAPALAVGFGRLTVPGHDLSWCGTAAAMLFIISGASAMLAGMVMEDGVPTPEECLTCSTWQALRCPGGASCLYGIAAVTALSAAGFGYFAHPHGVAYHLLFESAAHLWVGAMGAAAWWRWPAPGARFALGLLALLTAFEAFAFMARNRP